jgi:hypothetical protein
VQNLEINYELIKYFLYNLLRINGEDNNLYYYRLLYEFFDIAMLVGSCYP